MTQHYMWYEFRGFQLKVHLLIHLLVTFIMGNNRSAAVLVSWYLAEQKIRVPISLYLDLSYSSTISLWLTKQNVCHSETFYMLQSQDQSYSLPASFDGKL